MTAKLLFNVRITAAQKKNWEAQAERAGLSLSEYVRRTLDNDAVRIPKALFGVVEPQEEPE